MYIFEFTKHLDSQDLSDIWQGVRSENLKKFEGLQMPGGLTFNGQKIWEESMEEIRKLEDEMISSYSLPVHDMIG